MVPGNFSQDQKGIRRERYLDFLESIKTDSHFPLPESEKYLPGWFWETRKHSNSCNRLALSYSSIRVPKEIILRETILNCNSIRLKNWKQSVSFLNLYTLYRQFVQLYLFVFTFIMFIFKINFNLTTTMR